MDCTVFKKQSPKSIPLIVWSQTYPIALTNQFQNISVLAVMKPFPKYKGGGGGLKGEERDKSKGVVETGRQWSSVERSEWRQCGHAHCGHSAGTKRGRRDANYWSAAKDLSPCSAFSLSFCQRLNNEWELTASSPTTRLHLPPPHATSPYPISHSFCHAA